MTDSQHSRATEIVGLIRSYSEFDAAEAADIIERLVRQLEAHHNWRGSKSKGRECKTCGARQTWNYTHKRWDG